MTKPKLSFDEREAQTQYRWKLALGVAAAAAIVAIFQPRLSYDWAMNTASFFGAVAGSIAVGALLSLIPLIFKGKFKKWFPWAIPLGAFLGTFPLGSLPL